MKKLVLAALVVALAAISASTANAGGGSWYWTPGWCKAMLHKYGVEIDDGRTFLIEKSFCVGRGGRETCEFSRNGRTRLYSEFITIMRSYNGNVRAAVLRPTARDNYRLVGIRLLSRSMSANEFRRYAGGLATDYARAEHQKGCAPYSG